ncbi:PREDICTED: cytochrome b561 domain-containing protein 2 [Drosophila arizonae]|uniref:ascorbate ferrireductase (transmembrane) n=1 Tax=Drosophila arizonae TaxID=7263 RepID=A0ABM1NVF3_DROAR|nr:PREDICTED: cytochrome b561 domain-containing protein 2 [Drosophila arizonae]
MTEHLPPVISSTQKVIDYGSTSDSAKNLLPQSPPTAPTARAHRSSAFVHLNESSGGHRYSRMSHKLPLSETEQPLQRLEYSLNVLNQMCIGFVTIYISYLTLQTGLAGTSLHAWLVTIGFSFFMAEGVMVHYGGNVLTNSYKRSTKTTIHWILLTLGGGCGAAGALIKMIQKGFLLQSVHGRLGITAFILCLLAMSSGLAALCSARVKKLITPLLNKTFHNFLGFVCFVIALVTQYYGYETGYFKSRTKADFQILMKCITLISLVLSSYGPMKGLYHKIKSISRQF